MPPRTDDVHHSNYAADTLTIATLALSSSSKSNKRHPSSLLLSRPKQQRRSRIVFRNTHGIYGLISTVLTCIAIVTHHYTMPSSGSTTTSVISMAASILAAVTSVVTAASGLHIVDQAPKQTVVMTSPFRVVPPHRDAFRRTSYSIYYLGARICRNVSMSNYYYHDHSRLGKEQYSTITYNQHNNNNYTVLDWIWGIGCICYAAQYFIPKNPSNLDVTNGNTWIFVIPMAIGLSVDVVFQLPLFQCNKITHMCWNDNVVTQLDLLMVLLSGLLVAFVFTLAFRGVLGIRYCYWGAALVVHGIVAYLFLQSLPFFLVLHMTE